MEGWKSRQRREKPPLSRLKSPIDASNITSLQGDDGMALVDPEFIAWVHKQPRVCMYVARHTTNYVDQVYRCNHWYFKFGLGFFSLFP